MKQIVVILFLAALFTNYTVQAQDTLPSFTVANRNGRIILNWVNKFPVVKQLSIQRSSDSLKGFKTILTLPDPTAVTNGFLDNNAPDTVLFYKLYILLDSGKYVFSKSKRPEKKAMQPVAVTPGTGDGKPQGRGDEARKFNVSAANVSDRQRSGNWTGDTVTQVIAPVEIIKPSSFVFTGTDGNVTIVLPKDKFQQFSIRFFDPEGDPAFAINTIKEHIIIVDKSNFMRSGTFRFELYENGVVKEENKVQIPRFKSAK